MHLLAVGSTAVHIAFCSPFLDSLLDLLYSSSLSTYISLLGKILELSANQVISLHVSLISMYLDVKRASCQDVFLKECFCLHISFKVISTICLYSYLGESSCFRVFCNAFPERREYHLQAQYKIVFDKYCISELTLGDWAGIVRLKVLSWVSVLGVRLRHGVSAPEEQKIRINLKDH